MSIISIYNEFKNFKNHLDFVCQPASLPASQPAIRPGSARCTAPEIQHNKGNPVAFTKLLFRGRFTHCAVVILLYFLSLLSSLSIGMRKQFQRDHKLTYYHLKTRRCVQVKPLLIYCYSMYHNSS